MFETPEITKPIMPLRRMTAVNACWKPILFNFLLPGAGYWLIGQKTRARILFGVWCLFLIMAFLQLKFGMINGVRGGIFTPKIAPLEWLPTLGAAATAGVGPLYALFAVCFGGVGSEPIRNLTQEYGASYVMIAGLLNWLCCFDIFDRITGRWMWRLPKDELEGIEGALKEEESEK